MRWRKLGLVLAGAPASDWSVSHAMVPVAETLDDGRVRIYFTTRDTAGRSHITSVEIEDFPRGPLTFAPRPLLSPGPVGGFDDSGTMSCGLVRSGDEVRLYYIGWFLGRSVPFQTLTGLAVSTDGGRTFERASAAPVLGRSAADPYLATSPFVLRDGDTWRMWYSSGTAWRLEDGRPKHWYHIKHAASSDGVEWTPTGHVCIDYRDEQEHAIARPFVLREGGRYRMWYTSRGSTYRIGYAESDDGLEWRRLDDEAGIDVSPSGWDSEMVTYPCVLDHEGSRYLLYNGNGYGATGIGCAILDD